MTATRAKLVLAATLMSALPAAAGPNILSSHEIRYKHITFTCGEAEEQGKVRRFLTSAPYKINLPIYEPLSSDPGSSNWQVVYQTICEKAKRGTEIAVAH